MLASLGKENEGADIPEIFQIKLATRNKKDYSLIDKLLAENKEKQDKL